MYFVSLHGHGTSFSPSASGAPTECRPLTKSQLSASMTSCTGVPMRAMMFMLVTT